MKFRFVTTTPRTEICKDMFVDYKQFPAINQSALKLFDAARGGCPAKALHYIDHPDGETTEDQRFGSLFHKFVLEPDEFTNSVAVLDDDQQMRLFDEAVEAGSKAKGFSKTLATYQTWKKDCAVTGLEVVNDTLVKKFNVMRDGLMTDGDVTDVLTMDGQSEVSIYFGVPLVPDEPEGDQIQCKARIDWLPDGSTVYDLKSARSASPEQFARAVVKYSYDLQAEWYLRAANSQRISRDSYAWIVQEKDAPYIAELYVIPESWLSYARMENNAILSRLRGCIRSGDWPSYGGGELLPPEWLQTIIDGDGMSDIFTPMCDRTDADLSDELADLKRDIVELLADVDDLQYEVRRIEKEQERRKGGEA